jgi:hypothetical protein
MRKQFLILHIFILLSILSYSQNPEYAISNAIQNGGNFFVRFDSKNSFISNSQVRIWGMNLGMNYDNTVKFGGGLYNLMSPIEKNYLVESNGIKDTILTNLQYTYFSVFAEYVFYETKHWEASLPVQIGIGGTSYSGYKSDSTYLFHNKLILQYEATLTGHYRFLRYFALGGGVGYRIMLIDNKALGLQLTNPIYVVKFKIFLGDIFRDTKKLFQ